jgi:hypothetical protein
MPATRCLLLLAVLALGALAAPPPQPAPDALDRTLQAAFNRADLNHNSFLDVTELAVMFRGPRAQPAPDQLFDNKGNLLPAFRNAQQKYPDLFFLLAVDTDQDRTISWPEYRTYARNAAAQLGQQQRALPPLNYVRRHGAYPSGMARYYRRGGRGGTSYGQVLGAVARLNRYMAQAAALQRANYQRYQHLVQRQQQAVVHEYERNYQQMQRRQAQMIQQMMHHRSHR